MIQGFIIAFRLARRDLGGGFHGFRIMLACLALGVAAIAGIGSLTAAVRDGLARDARTLLGGDLDIRLTGRPADAEQVAWFRGQAHVSTIARMRTMAARGDGGAVAGRTRALIELKAVDRAYPLLGKVTLAPAMDLEPALARASSGRFGAVVDAGLLTRLGLHVGDRMRLGLALFDIRAVLEDEPDKASGVFKLGPRVIVAEDGLAGTGLVQPGSLIRWHYRLRYPPGTDGAALEAALEKAFPAAPWRVRNVHAATPRIQRHIDRAALFFTLIGLAALLVGGIGVGGAVGGHLDNKRDTIATFKCLGATGGTIFTIFALEIAMMAAAGIAIGLVFGAGTALALMPILAPYLPVAPGVSLYPAALAVAAAYGVTRASQSTQLPLARARAVPAAALFRGPIGKAVFRPGIGLITALALSGAAVAGLAVTSTHQPSLAGWFILGALIAFAIFGLAGRGVTRFVVALSRHITVSGWRHPRLQLALANIARPGAPTTAIVTALGIGLTLFVALAQIEGNFQRRIADRMPDSAPAYFFIDIQPGQVAAFEAAVRSVPGVGAIDRLPSLRGRIVKVNGTPVSDIAVGPGARWAVESDRGITYVGPMPDGAGITDGSWWPPDYSGPPLVSLDARIAGGLGIGVGDTITLNVLGRELTARIKNTRKIDWARLGLNFTMIFAPGLLEDAPQTFIATVKASPAAEEPLARTVIDRFGNVTAIHVREALAAVAEALGKIGMAARAMAGLALISGIFVLAGAIAAGRRERARDAVILKVTGARRRDLMVAYLFEYGIIGIIAAVIAAILGTFAAALVLTQVMGADWVFLPGPAVAALIGACLAVIGFGFAGTWRALAQAPAHVLRDTART